MNAQQLINTCDNHKTSQRKFRNEINISFLINDVKKQFIISGNGKGGQNSSSDSPSPLKITEKGGKHGNNN